MMLHPRLPGLDAGGQTGFCGEVGCSMPRSGRKPAVEAHLIEELCKHSSKDMSSLVLRQEVLENRCPSRMRRASCSRRAPLQPDDVSGLLADIMGHGE